MGLIVDTSVIIAAERGTFDMEGLLAAFGEEPVAISAITASELLHGVERARDEATRSRRQRAVDGVIDAFPVLPFALPEARVHARLWAALAAKGKMIGSHDLQVAATCLAHGATIVTLNAAEFKRVPGLRLADVKRFARA